MPQRTRKEKIAAQQRKALRYTIIEHEVNKELPKESTSGERPLIQSASTVNHHVVVQAKTAHTMPKNHKEKVEISQEEMAIKAFFLQDLQKSLLFIVGILALEIILYFARISNYFLR